ncbi:putative Phytocyanin domain, cupredoxin [Helianthus annuus]|nr:putative Phytocyanin domain, cupredoxin [Helianthus annuus]
MSSSPLYNSINRWFIAMTNIIQTHTFLKITLFFQEYKIMAKVSIMRVLIGLAAMVMLLQVVVATDYTVGSPSGGWDTTTDLGSWSSSQTFTVGDNLDFQFGPTHDVVEVTKDNYDSCGTGNAISTTTCHRNECGASIISYITKDDRWNYAWAWVPCHAAIRIH